MDNFNLSNLTDEELLTEINKRPELKTMIYRNVDFNFRKQDTEQQLLDYFETKENALNTLRNDD